MNVTKMATKSVSFALAIAVAETAVSVVNPHANVASLHHDTEKQVFFSSRQGETAGWRITISEQKQFFLGKSQFYLPKLFLKFSFSP
jgi:hypothetical protein